MHTQTYITCGSCGHRNELARSPYKNAKLIIAGTDFGCRGCGKEMTTRGMSLKLTPMRQRALKELLTEGITPECALT